jgi:xylulokinase
MKRKTLLGIDIGSSSSIASMLDTDTGELVGSRISPEQEMKIDSPHMGRTEQNPEVWRQHVITATKK